MREILIRLEDELYEQCKNTKLTEENEGFDFHIIKSVANGTPFPKGHGKIIDSNEFNHYLISRDSSFKALIAEIPPIIEVDGGEKDADSN